MRPDEVPAAIEALWRRRSNVRPAELHEVLTAAGFERRLGKGDHWVYTHWGRRDNLSIDPRRPLLPIYVKNAIRAIEEVLP